jgi:hypothetical protein
MIISAIARCHGKESSEAYQSSFGVFSFMFCHDAPEQMQSYLFWRAAPQNRFINQDLSTLRNLANSLACHNKEGGEL